MSENQPGRHRAGGLTEYLPTVAKGIAAGATAFAGAMGVALVDGIVSPGELWTAAAAALTAAGVVWGVPNSEAPS